MNASANSGLPLDTLAKTIMALYNKAADQRVAAGKYLVEARQRVGAGEAGDLTWDQWIEEFLTIKKRQVQILLSEGGDPKKVAANRAKNAARNADHRAHFEYEPTAHHVMRDDPGPETTREDDPYVVLNVDPVQAAIAVLDALSDTDRRAVLAHYWAQRQVEPRGRDTQRSAAYEWEREVYADQHEEDRLGEEETREYVASVAGDLGVPVPPMSFTVRANGSTRAYESWGTLNFGKEGDNRVVILHELAHVLTPGEAHGPEWIAVYAALVERYLGVPARAALESQPKVPCSPQYSEAKPSDATGWTEVTDSYGDDDADDEYDEDDNEYYDEYNGGSHWEKRTTKIIKVKYDPRTLARWQERLAPMLAMAA